MRSATLSVLLLLACGCGSSNEPDPRAAASLTVISGDAQQAEVGTDLPEPVVVKVSDANGVPVPNQLINFVVVSGGGRVFAGAAQTNAAGEARERWTLGTVAGEQMIEVRAVDQSTGEPIVFARITAKAEPGPPVSLELSESEHQLFIGDRLDLAPLATVQDQYGNAVTGLAFTVTAAPPFETQGTTVASSVEHEGQVTIESGVASGILTVKVVRHLSALVGARGSYSCSGLMVRQNSFEDTDPRGVVTRYQARFAVDSAVYPNVEGALPSLWITTNSLTITREDGSVETTEPLSKEELHILQRVGDLYLGMEIGFIHVVSEAPLTYKGDIAYCPHWWSVSAFEPYTITQ
jgi:hypothetical protein